MDSKNIVILVGSGRSGTTWLASLLDTYENVEYYYETKFFNDLKIGETDFSRIKYPLTFWIKNKSKRVKILEKKILSKAFQWNVKQELIKKTLRINHSVIFNKKDIYVELFKEVALINVALDLERLEKRYHEKLKLIHLIRNPLSYISSELRQQEKNINSAELFFKNRLNDLLNEKRLEKYHPLLRDCLNKGFIAHLTILWWVGNDMLINQNIFPCKLVTYEELCDSSDEKLKEIFSFLGWETGKQTLSHLSATTNVKKQEQEKGEWSLIKDSSFTRTRWKHDLKKEDHELIMGILEECELLSLWPPETLIY